MHASGATLFLSTLLLLPGAAAPARLTLPTAPPVLPEDDFGYLSLLPEKEFRQAMKRHRGDEGFVPLGSAPSGLSGKALFDVALVLDQAVTLAVDGDSERGYTLVVDLNADGSLANDRRWPMARRTLTLWDFAGARGPKEASVGEVITTLPREVGGAKTEVPFRMQVAITEDMVRIPGEEGLRRQALSSQSTLREGTIRLGGREIGFALRGVGGIYDDDFNCVVFDLNGDGILDSGKRDSPEYYWVWERTVSLAGNSYEFQVDRFGRSLTLSPFPQRIPDHPSLEIGHPAPEFSFTDLEGRRHRLRDYRGQVVLIDFWGTWCPACVAHAKELAEAYRRLHRKGFEILGIHGGGNEEEVRRFTVEHAMTWPQTLETGSMPEGRPLQKLYRIFGAPNYFLVGSKGEILLSESHKPVELIREVERQLRVRN